ncbi:MAG: hypothetical protein JXR60_07660 [Bacteroidales bacterium]|nr:hypothetical protein [Bacteroidales bacterium]
MPNNDLNNIKNCLSELNVLTSFKTINLIEADLLLDKTRRLYEHITNLKLAIMSEGSSQTKEIQVEEVKPESKKMAESPSEAQVEDVKVEFLEPKKDLEPVIENDPIELVEEKPIPDVVKKPAERKVIKEELKEETPKQEKIIRDSTKSVAEQFESKKSLNDLLSEIKQNTDLATQLKNRPIEDLKNAISLNDKIWFIRELFTGNADRYNQTIEQINSFKGMSEAIDLVSKFGWNQEESSTKRFLELIYRKFVR